jgi:hypothetical protein
MREFIFAVNAKRNFDGILGQSLVIFTNSSVVQNLGPAPLKLKKVSTKVASICRIVQVFPSLAPLDIRLGTYYSNRSNSYGNRCRYV